MERVSATLRRVLLSGVVLYLVAFGLMRLSTPPGVERERITISDSQGRALPATLWKPAATPKAVMLVGHGVTSNQGIMATISKGFAAQGYLVVTFDFYGHGLSRERFDWMGNPAQLLDICAWAKAQYPGLPMGYLGHSMGGFAGGEAFVKQPDAVGAFVAMGAIPRQWSTTKTLVAAGQFEELFTPEQAKEKTAGHADLLISPYSDHNLEASDPVLLQGMIAWVDKTLGLPAQGGFHWGRWCLVPIALILGVGGAVALAAAITRTAAGKGTPRLAPERRPWRFNPYRVAGALLRCEGPAAPPLSGGFPRALLLGLLFVGVLVPLLSNLFAVHVFAARLDHPARLMGWAVAACVFILLGFLDSTLLERIPLRSAWKRFGVAALTRAVPLILLSASLHIYGPPIAFLGMMLGILAFIAIMASVVRALATRATGDYRAGVVASSVVLAWIISFWMPLQW
jgi:pimeloyl-ACP methyl ester carboxylesterase